MYLSIIPNTNKGIDAHSDHDNLYLIINSNINKNGKYYYLVIRVHDKYYYVFTNCISFNIVYKIWSSNFVYYINLVRKKVVYLRNLKTPLIK